MKFAKGLEGLLEPIDGIVELNDNPRRGDVDAVKRSYDRFGQRKPIVVRHDEDGVAVCIAGNHQLRAARELGWESIAVSWGDDLTDDEAKAYALADNRIAELGDYEIDVLANAVLELHAKDATLAEAAGYSEEAVKAFDFEASIEDLLGDLSPVYETPAEGMERYLAQQVIGITFPIPAEQHDELVTQLFALRRAFDHETTTETFMKLVGDAHAALEG
jgi:hypothetical protein